MEIYIKNNLFDITYKSELTPHLKGAVLIRANNLRCTFSASVSYALIKNGNKKI